MLSHIESTLDAGLGQERQQLPIYARRGSQVLEVLSGAAVWLYHQRLLDGDLSGGQGPGVVYPEIIKDLALRDHQQIAVYKALTTWMGRGILQLPAGSGKAMPLSTQVVTPDGHRQLGSLQVGDAISSPTTGLSTIVTGVYPQGRKLVYRVLFSDGSVAVCCGEHLWTTRKSHDARTRCPFSVASLAEMIKYGLQRPEHGCRFFIPITAPVHFTPCGALPLDPYLLGLLLGDGGFTHGTPTFHKEEPDLLAQVASRLPGDMEVHRLSSYSYSLVDTRASCIRPNQLRVILEDLGLWGLDSLCKFIPEMYLRAEPSDRLALLRGLIDTDGDISSEGMLTTANTSSLRLSDGIAFLVRSLGGIARTHSRIPEYTYKGERRRGAKAYRISVRMPNGICPVSSDKHMRHWQPTVKYHPHRGIVSAEPVGEEECVCISVDSPDGLFMVDDFVVTHNTRVAGAIAGASALERWLYLAPNEELAQQTEDAVGEAVSRAGSKLVCRSFGSVTQLELEEAEGLLIDEVHTLGAKGRALVVAGASNAEMRIGLSATALDRQDQGNSLVIGLTGPIIFSLGCEVLVDRGVLAKGHVTRIAVPY